MSRNSFFLTLLLDVPRSPSSPPLSPLPPSPLMSEISPQEYLTMANQAYIVAYVTGSVYPTFPPFPLSQSPTIAACATTLLYDYALTLGEEVRIICSFLTKPSDHPHLLPQIARMWSSVTLVLTLTRSILTSHSPQSPSLDTKVPIPNQQICRVTYASVRIRPYHPVYPHTSNPVPALTGLASISPIRPQPLSFSPFPQLHRGLTFRKTYVPCMNLAHPSC